MPTPLMQEKEEKRHMKSPFIMTSGGGLTDTRKACSSSVKLDLDLDHEGVNTALKTMGTRYESMVVMMMTIMTTRR
jgi:hypothetical protein